MSGRGFDILKGVWYLGGNLVSWRGFDILMKAGHNQPLFWINFSGEMVWAASFRRALASASRDSRSAISSRSDCDSLELLSFIWLSSHNPIHPWHMTRLWIPKNISASSGPPHRIPASNPRLGRRADKNITFNFHFHDHATLFSPYKTRLDNRNGMFTTSKKWLDLEFVTTFLRRPIRCLLPRPWFVNRFDRVYEWIRTGLAWPLGWPMSRSIFHIQQVWKRLKGWVGIFFFFSPFAHLEPLMPLYLVIFFISIKSVRIWSKRDVSVEFLKNITEIFAKIQN